MESKFREPEKFASQRQNRSRSPLKTGTIDLWGWNKYKWSMRGADDDDVSAYLNTEFLTFNIRLELSAFCVYFDCNNESKFGLRVSHL